MNYSHLIETALGQREPDLVLKNARIIQVLTGEIISGDVAICDGWIAGIGQYYGKNSVDLQGKYLSPGFINAHCHVESSMALPETYCEEELRSGVTAVITDPHEIANVSGTIGIQFMLERSQSLPIHYYVQLPSCVPATPLEHSGSTLHAEELLPFFSHPRVSGLGEMMDFHGISNQNPEVLKKLEYFRSKILDGHLPSPDSALLQAYACAGIQTDHESVTYEEARDKLRAGLSVLIREGSGSKNLDAIVSGILQNHLDTSHLAFCTDDKHLFNIHQEGTIRYHIQRSIELGMDPMTAYQIATIQPARIYRLERIGAIAPGYRADLVVLDDWKTASVCDVYFGGTPLHELCCHPKMPEIPQEILHSVHLPELSEASFQLLPQEQYPVIRMIPGQILTQKETISRDEARKQLKLGKLLKLVVVERHHATGNIGVGLLAGYGLHNGAIATTVAHDSHNLILAGDNDADLLLAAQQLQQVQGGYTLVSNQKVVDTLPLPVAGLMSMLSTQELSEKIETLSRYAYNLGVEPSMDPFIALSFLALPVLPEIRLTDMGIVDLLS